MNRLRNSEWRLRQSQGLPILMQTWPLSLILTLNIQKIRRQTQMDHLQMVLTK